MRFLSFIKVLFCILIVIGISYSYDISDNISKACKYSQSNNEQYLEGFMEFLRIPTISADHAYRRDVEKGAEFIVKEMTRIGIKNSQIIQTEGCPAVYGEWLDAGKDKPTVLIYAHYDVQPVDPLDLWESPPFQPAIRDNKLYARGVADDKKGVYFNLKAMESILKTEGSLPLNIKFFFEGEEESGSPSAKAFLQKNRDLLKADLIMLCDGGSVGKNASIMSSTRGIVLAEVTVTGPKKDLHSGIYGGVVHNPTHMVSKIIAAMHDSTGHVKIPGFYDAVRPLEKEDYEAMKETEETRKQQLFETSGIDHFWGVPEYSIMERASAQPTCDVNGIFGGYSGQGNKTIIPAKAGFKVSMRLVEAQDHDDIAEKFANFINGFKTNTVNIELALKPGSPPCQLLTKGPVMDAVNKAYQKVCGNKPIIMRQGGSVPVMGILKNELGIPIINVGLSKGGNKHSPNEYIELNTFQMGINLAIHVYYYLSEITM
jgi:acetylornithine deacetylase/succinyl-diaminopimelate desuccinylase-like protein